MTVLGGVCGVMVFVDDPEAASRWWSDVLDTPARTQDGYVWVEIGGVELGFHPADDERNPRGGSTVVYWRVTDLTAARERMLAAGCRPHRGPLRIAADRRICQLTDPFGLVFGLDGP